MRKRILAKEIRKGLYTLAKNMPRTGAPYTGTPYITFYVCGEYAVHAYGKWQTTVKQLEIIPNGFLFGDITTAVQKTAEECGLPEDWITDLTSSPDKDIRAWAMKIGKMPIIHSSWVRMYDGVTAYDGSEAGAISWGYLTQEALAAYLLCLDHDQNNAILDAVALSMEMTEEERHNVMAMCEEIYNITGRMPKDYPTYRKLSTITAILLKGAKIPATGSAFWLMKSLCPQAETPEKLCKAFEKSLMAACRKDHLDRENR